MSHTHTPWGGGEHNGGQPAQHIHFKNVMLNKHVSEDGIFSKKSPQSRKTPRETNGAGSDERRIPGIARRRPAGPGSLRAALNERPSDERRVALTERPSSHMPAGALKPRR